MGEAIKVQVGEFIFYGYESPCPGWLHDKYREAVNYICADCHKHEDEVGKLEPHRIRRGCEDGLYTVLPIKHIYSNVKPCCNGCHKVYNYSKILKY